MNIMLIAIVGAVAIVTTVVLAVVFMSLRRSAAPPAAPSTYGGTAKYCSNCGAEVADVAVVCVKCGAQVGRASSANDMPNFGFAALGFFFPIVGLVLYLVWKDEFPLKAASCGKGALTGFVLSTLTYCAFYALLGALGGIGF